MGAEVEPGVDTEGAPNEQAGDVQPISDMLIDVHRLAARPSGREAHCTVQANAFRAGALRL